MEILRGGHARKAQRVPAKLLQALFGPSRASRRRSLEPLEPRRMLHHAGHDPSELQLGVYDGSYVKADDYVDEEYEAELASGVVASAPLTSIPVLHSLAGAVASIYLDFDGHFEALWGNYSNITTPVFDIDGDATTFSDTELTRITNIWKRVAEDFAPFQIDVTTENPGDFSNGKGLRVSIGGGGAWYGSPAGGVAYIGNYTSGVPNTVYVFPDALGKNEKSIAEASSHEAGHAFGLQHQSTFDANGIKIAEYNPGGGGWAPIMGVSYSQALSTWHNGTSSLGPNVLQDDLAGIGKPENGFGFRPDDHLDSVGSGTPLVLTENVVSGSGIIGAMSDIDAFSFSTDAGNISLSVNVAQLGPNLDTILELRNSSGVLIASASPSGDLNATISTSVIAGDYTLLVKSTGDYGRVGQYTVSGTINAGLFVIDHTPAEGSVVTTLLTDFVLDFSEAIDMSTVSADELLVNGIAASSFSIVDSDSVEFQFAASPISTQGEQLMTMAAGSVATLADGSPLNPFTGVFRYDALPLAVVSTNPALGATATLPVTSLAFNFNEQYDASSVSLSDLVLSHGQVTGVTFTDSDTITFTISGITSEGTLDYSLPAGAIADLFGNPSVAYSGNVLLDFDTTAFPIPLNAVEPLGSQVFDPPVSASIGLLGDTDTYTLELPAGAIVSVVVDPAATLQPTIELLGPGDAPITSSSAAATGQDAVVQTVAIASSGVHKIRVSGASGTGSYLLQVVLNAAVESEEHNGPANATPGTAQNIDGAFIDLGGDITQGAVVGVTDPDNGLLPAELEPNNSVATADLASHNFGAPPANRYQLGLTGTIGSSGDLDYFRIGTMQVGDVITVSLSGTGGSRGTLGDSVLNLYRGTGVTPILVSSNDDGGASLDSLIYRFTVTTADTYSIRAAGKSTATGSYQIGVFLENSGAAPTTGGAVTTETESNNTNLTANIVSSSWRQVQHLSATTGSITTGDVDYFAYEFQAGDLITVLADATSGTLDATLALLNSAGTVIASEDGTSIGQGTDSNLYGYIIPATGTYYVRTMASAGTGNYTTSVFLSTATPPTAPATRGDYFAITLDAGESVTVSLRALADASMSLAITDALGNVLAPSVGGSTNLDRVVNGFVAPSAGVYYVKVDGDAAIPFNLVVTRNAAFDTEGNDDASGSLVSLDDLAGAVGHVNANHPSWFGQWDMTIDSTQTFVGIEATFAGVPLLEQSPGSLVTNYQGAIRVIRDPIYASFPGGSFGDAIAHPGPFLPINGPADYAGYLELFEGANANGTFSNISFDVNSSLLGPVGSSGDGEPVSGTFPANSVVFTFTSGVFDYEVPGVLSGSESIAGLSELNSYEGTGSLDEIDGVLYLTLPVLVQTTVIEPTTQLPFDVTLSGQIVATQILPGPIDPVDWYEVVLAPGEKLVLSTDTPLDDSSLVTANSLDPTLQVLGPGDLVVAEDDNSAADGKNASLTYVATVGGIYRVGVRANSGEGSYVLHSGVEPPDPAPRVVNVAVRGAAGMQPSFDIPTGSGDQIRSVPVGKVDQISVTFSTTVNVQQDDLSLTGQGDRPPYTFSNFSYQAGTNTAVWTLSAPIDTDQLLLLLNSDGPSPITNLAGQALDGEWTNPSTIEETGTSNYPSGDGNAGGDFSFVFTVSPGDANRDNVVDGADYTVWADHFLEAGSLATSGDFNTDGFVDGADYTVWADHFAPNLSAVSLSPPSSSPVEASAAAATDAVVPAINFHRVGGWLRELAESRSDAAQERREARRSAIDRWMSELALTSASVDPSVEILLDAPALGRRLRNGR